MTLEVIGAGFSRTGTLSLKVALEQLGFGPCYHMMEVMGSPVRPAHWMGLLDGGLPDWDAIFDGYRSTVDWPACTWWRELADAYPDAKVILSLRDGQGWYDSVMNTIYHALVAKVPEAAPPHIHTQIRMVGRLVGERTFAGRIEDRAHAIDVFDRHNRQVIDAIPNERLLVYRPGDGWEPLCRFLDCDVPASDFPRLNDTAEFRARLGLPPVANS